MRKITTLLPIVAALGVAVPAFAQQQASNLSDLLNQVQQVRAETNATFDKRRAEYEAAGSDAQKAALMQKAEQQRKELDASSQKLADTYSANEVRINNLNQQLRDKAAKLGLAEIFGLARQAANDDSTILQQSLISTQFPPAAGQPSRDEWLREFSSSRATPMATDLERLWVEIQREMTASGQVAKYKTRIVQPGGQNTEADVIRIGPFNAMANGQFLQYLPSLHTFSVLPRQLPPQFMRVAAAFQNATSGYAQAVVDPNRGVLLGLYVERPTVGERIQRGEEVGYVIIVVGVLGVLAFLYQLVSLIVVRLGVSKQLKNLDKPSKNNPLGRVLLAFKGDPNRIEEDAEVAELRITEAVLREVPKLERFQAFLRLAVAAGPLLGLIGTVVGMIVTFQSITESGSSDPKLMAGGIGRAMIATVLGLGIAIPLLFANALLNSLSRGIVQILDEQSAGMLAESIEKKRHA
ncbi:MAG TPA: MotA/TolQ/ExbB proton channel family protein [Gammaproteobacteria bacterium]|jgi:biopolymer transport protein ExbB|nr:MotA/TolQ/ExbB proton channel family protein [Gammaproteobacteria bacterium]